MSTHERIRMDLMQATKTGNAPVRDVLRLVDSALRNREIALRSSGKELDEAEVIAVIETQVKQRRDSIEQYRAGKREDLAEKEEAEKTIIEAYLPEEISKEEIDRIVERVVNEMAPVGMSDMGKVMGAVMSRVKAQGRVDGNVVKDRVSAYLRSL